MAEGSVGRRKKILWIVVSAFLVVAVTVIVIVVVFLNSEHSEEDEQQAQEQIALNNEATGYCNEMNDLYDDGAIPLNIAKQYFENAIKESGNEIYTMHIIVCYANFVYDAGEGIEQAVKIMDRLEPWFDNEAMLISYYNGMMGLYGKDGNTEKVNYYGDLAYELDGDMEENDED